ncbi:MAG: histidine phosphatase family protein [Anaerolineales bacterium]|nr:MAG: histidine phosphatase family protein [Anaerolineales bacterium]
MYEFVLLRHAESQGNIDKKHQGQAEFPLTELGRQQATALAEQWRGEKVEFTRIFSSPLQRARQTAEIVKDALGAHLELDPMLAERHLGELTGLTHELASQQVPPPPFLTPYEPYGNTGEGQWQLFLRAGQVLHHLLSQPRGKYLVVSHRAFLGMLMYAILGISPHANFQGPRFHFQNTGYARLTYDTHNHQWRMFAFNDLSHLGDLPVSSLLVPAAAHNSK